jgi:hypothetical protein
VREKERQIAILRPKVRLVSTEESSEMKKKKKPLSEARPTPQDGSEGGNKMVVGTQGSMVKDGRENSQIQGKQEGVTRNRSHNLFMR